MDTMNKTVVVGDKNFYVAKIPALKALRLDHRLIKMISPVLKMLATVSNTDSGKLKIDFSGDAASILSDSFSEIIGRGSDEALSLVLDLLEYAIYLPPGNPSVVVKGNEDAIFTDSPLEIYQLAFEVARMNKFTPFALTSVGDPSETDG